MVKVDSENIVKSRREWKDQIVSKDEIMKWTQAK